MSKKHVLPLKTMRHYLCGRSTLLSPFQVTTPPEMRFHALLSEGAQEVCLKNQGP
jgi:hypothetical protein